MWNINGLTIEKLIKLIDDLRKYDITVLCKTWLKSLNSYDMNIRGYKAVSVLRARTNRKSKEALAA